MFDRLRDWRRIHARCGSAQRRYRRACLAARHLPIPAEPSATWLASISPTLPEDAAADLSAGRRANFGIVHPETGTPPPLHIRCGRADDQISRS
ncbi:hypothetical protein QLH51_14230 [Sphingomonas sp. 2R-10]|uniref:hypothetical protein n=1 Tax=Sphingomonas sp. 2R-10 TaxID=3045148 RepID=UPI000F782030|nr:hypothetical protein [Sphingomonas sp. 2R-10]MDJ0277956.1 hypothetical protein [Sphingomonas sp. 2R-10]